MYYYFAASLPMLFFDVKPSMSVESFLADCRRLLTGPDYSLVARLLSEDDPESSSGERSPTTTPNPAWKAWVRFNRDFRNELAWYRANRLSKDPQRYLRGLRFAEPFLAEQIQQASKTSNPLEAQKFLDKVKWRFLDEIERGHYYDIEFLCVYGLRLKILEHHQECHSPKGRDIFGDLRRMPFPESCILEPKVKRGIT